MEWTNSPQYENDSHQLTKIPSAFTAIIRHSVDTLLGTFFGANLDVCFNLGVGAVIAL